MSHPPHLPPRESKPPRPFKEFFLFLSVIVLISFVSGIAASSVTFTWLVPTSSFSGSSFPFFEKTKSNGESTLFDEKKQQEMEERTIWFFDKRKEIQGRFFDASASFGSGALLTLDGWVVVSGSKIKESDLSFVIAKDYFQKTYTVDKIKVEPVLGLTFLHIEGQGFPVFSLESKFPLDSGSLWSFDGEKTRAVSLAFDLPSSKESQKSIGELVAKTETEIPAGVFVVDKNASLVGMVGKGSLVISSSEILSRLRAFQKNSEINTKAFSIMGFVVESFQNGKNGKPEKVFGFLVTDAGVFKKNGLSAGDIVVQVNKSSFDPKNARAEILFLSEEMELLIIRNKKEEIIVIKK